MKMPPPVELPKAIPGTRCANNQGWDLLAAGTCSTPITQCQMPTYVLLDSELYHSVITTVLMKVLLKQNYPSSCSCVRSGCRKIAFEETNLCSRAGCCAGHGEML